MDQFDFLTAYLSHCLRDGCWISFGFAKILQATICSTDLTINYDKLLIFSGIICIKIDIFAYLKASGEVKALLAVWLAICEANLTLCVLCKEQIYGYHSISLLLL